MVKTLGSARASLYFWWIAYLRKSIDYWWVCQNKGHCEDERLHRVWQDFGDLYSFSRFDDWWLERATDVFGISPTTPFAPHQNLSCICESDKNLFLSQNLPQQGVFFYLPFHTEITRAQETFIATLKQLQDSHTSFAQNQFNLISLYNLCPLDLKSQQMLIPIYRTLSLNECVELAKPGNPLKSWGGYEIGKNLEIAPQHKPKPADSLEITKTKQCRIRSLVSQHKKAASLLIANVEIGRFPCKSQVEPKMRWTPAQLKRRNEAINDGQWQGEGWLSKEFDFMDPAQGRLLNADHLSPQEEILSILAAFNDTDQSFLKPKRKPKN